MSKRIAILAAIAIFAAMLGGCLPKPPAPWDEAAERALVAKALGDWVKGVENYNVDAMAGENVLAAGFRLTITEGAGAPYPKELEVLRAELAADAEDQANFRKPPTNYRLELAIPSWSIANLTQTTADASCTFTVNEWSSSATWLNSDRGDIVVELVKSGGVWKMTSMHITFKEQLAPTAANAGASGFGFGKLF